MPFRSALRALSLVLFINLAFGQDSGRAKSYAPSPFVPMESYIYELLDRLSSQGAIDSQFVGVRPWTRAQCAKLVEEAAAQANPDDEFQLESLRVLKSEFAQELGMEAQSHEALEEIYVRSVTVGGQPLPDFHFGQTTYNDYGRSATRGENVILGLAGSQTWNRFIVHVRAEFQHAAADTLLSADQQVLLDTLDDIPGGVPKPAQLSNQGRFIEAYLGFPVHSVNVSIGKQTLWWGPSPTSTTLASTNAGSMYMLRIQQDAPVRLPWVLRHLGSVRWDAFLAKLDGHRYPADQYLHGQKISFKPTPNLELGFSRTVIFAGQGRGLTFGNFWQSFVSVGDKVGDSPGSSQDVGDRRGGFDFSYRVPGLRKWATAYGDFFTDDDPSPLASLQRSGMLPGLYISQLPFARKLDLRLEALITDQSATDQYRGSFFYYNKGYKDGYTHNGQLLGSWIGRDAKAVMASTRYWLSPTTDLKLSYRNVKTSKSYLPGGGTQHDIRLSVRSVQGGRMRIEGFVQYEQYRIPSLSKDTTRNICLSLEFGYRRK